ncbi:MAG TPA: DUF1016 N-terminal domain-containing protein [Candidatus Omnitrophota bacterium]|nr:DUF1016 N-terminal domain-containing protein [Candidatus Omnitrophota bacterium]HRY86072.1 DUF1016 N-terminal domain-containing protein [Candidatus Omnitrophota bacterium]
MPNAKLAAATYKKLITDIASLYEGARKALVEAYWTIGKRMVQVEQKGEVRAAYGDNIIPKLSEDLTRQLGQGFSETNLKRFRQFYLRYPKSPPAGELNWAQHIELLSIRDERKRLQLERRTGKENLKRDELRELVRQELVREQVAAARDEKKEPPELLTPPKDLTLHTYKKGEVGSPTGATTHVVDCGFYVFRELTRAQYESVTVTAKPTYAYEATVERVIDGDTLWAVIDLGFGTKVREKLRLRGLDCPEMDTEEGKQAAEFVKARLKPGSKIILVSSKTDKYTRYLADVFFTDAKGEEQYLNNLLLESGLAVNMY